MLFILNLKVIYISCLKKKSNACSKIIDAKFMNIISSGNT